MVSPPEKNGGDALIETTRTRAATDGSALAFASLAGFGESQSNLITSEYMSVRGPERWSTHDISPPQEPLSTIQAFSSWQPRYMGEFTPDLSKGIAVSKTAQTESPNAAAAVNLYRRDDARDPGVGSYTLLSDATTLQAPNPFSQGFWPWLADSSPDLSHVVFESPRNLTADAVGMPTNQKKIYKWIEGAPATLSLIGYVPTAPDTSCGGGGPACVRSASKAGQDGVFPGPNYADGTITDDGSRVVFTASPFFFPGGTLYVRDDQGTSQTSDDTTTQLNTSEKTVPDSAEQATFWAASSGVDSEGTRAPLKAFFTTTESLTDDDVGGDDLYMWSENANNEGHHLTRLSVDSEPSGTAGGEVGVVGVSRDGSYVYFAVEGGQLVAGGPTGDCGQASGGCTRLFVWHGGTIRPVGTVNEGQVEGDIIIGKAAISWGFNEKFSRVTPDGTVMAFVTEGTAELTGYDHGIGCNETGAGPQCYEVYAYDATANSGAGQLTCVSCNQSGAAATADASFVSRYAEGTALRTSHLNRAITDDGRYVFFSTAERLVPEDTNGTGDAYEYDMLTGEQHLLSSGEDAAPSFFLEASADGSDVFFATREQLSGWDFDEGTDVYDARVNGGLPEPPPAPASCQGDACQPPPIIPNDPTPGSASFSGPGNSVAKSRKKKRRHQRKRHHRDAQRVRTANHDRGGNR